MQMLSCAGRPRRVRARAAAAAAAAARGLRARGTAAACAARAGAGRWRAGGPCAQAGGAPALRAQRRVGAGRAAAAGAAGHGHPIQLYWQIESLFRRVVHLSPGYGIVSCLHTQALATAVPGLQSSWHWCWCLWVGQGQLGYTLCLHDCGGATVRDSAWVGAQAQAGAQAAQQQEAVYRAALQELTLFKSRTSAALLQARTSMQSALCLSCWCATVCMRRRLVYMSSSHKLVQLRHQTGW